MNEIEKQETENKYRMVALLPEVYEEIRRLAFDDHVSQGEIVARAIAALRREEVSKNEESISDL